MSKLIVEMEMPRDCWCCPNGHFDWIYNDDGAAQMVCFCNICNTEEDDKWISETETERPSWCPIVGVLPEEHGRLIDADAAVADIRDAILEYKMDGLKGTPIPTDHLWVMEKWIADEDVCPTIVPATERSET